MGIYDRGYYRDEEWKGGRGVRAPRSMIALIIIINVAVFVLDMFTPVVSPFNEPDPGVISPPAAASRPANQSQWVSVTLALKTNAGQDDPLRSLPPNYGVGPLENPLMVWQLLTYGFAHASLKTDTGIMHIAFNMLILFFLGRAVEYRYGSNEFIKFYLIAIVVAGLAWLIAHALRGDAGLAVGASGAVSATVILFVLNYPKQTLLFMGILPMPAWLLGVILVVGDILNSFNSESQIAVEAHLAGAAFAAAYFYGKWNFQWLRFDWLRDRLSGKPRLRVHTPERGSERISDQADQILEKLHREGEESLTRRERKILEQYSKNVRNRRRP